MFLRKSLAIGLEEIQLLITFGSHQCPQKRLVEPPVCFDTAFKGERLF